MRTVFFSLLLIVSILAPAADSWADELTVRVGLFPLEPLNFIDQSGEATGLNPDLIREAFKDKSLNPVFVSGSWGECLERLEKEEIDLMTTVAISPERTRIMDFSEEPVLLVWGQVYQKHGAKVNNILDLNGKTVAIMRKDQNGINFIQTLASFGGSCKIIELSSHEDVFRAVQSGEALGGVAPHHFGLRHCNRFGLTATSIQFSPFSVHFATRKGKNNHLLRILDEKIKNWKAGIDSFYYNRLNYWLGVSHKDNPVIPNWVLALLFTLLAVTAMSLWGNKILKKLIERKTRELIAQEKDFRNLVESANSIIIRLDAEKRIKFINRFGLQLLKFSADELLGKHVLETILPKTQSDGVNFQTVVDEVFLHPEDYVIVENENLCGDGTKVYVQWSNRAFYDENGNFLEMICIGNDITSRKKLEMELLQTQKMEALGRLAGGIAHDFNNILFVISGSIDLAKMRADKPDLLSKYLANIEAAAGRAKNLVKQILAFSRKEPSKKTLLGPAAEIKEAIKMLRPTLPSNIIIVENYASEKKILADPNQLHQVIMNLCTNSMHALNGESGILTITVDDSPARKGSEISISDEKRAFVRIVVSDTGQGIAQKNLSMIFEPFFTTKDKHKGTGMGLAVVHGIVKEHGGEIMVTSEPGKGATFEILLPVAEQREVDTQIQADVEPQLAGCERIMLVDDETGILEVNAEILKNHGYQVNTFVKPLEALEAFEKLPEQYDLVITDMTMPEITGATLTQRILKARPGFPVMLITGYSDRIDSATAAEMGIAAFAYKPLTPNDLLKEIRKILDAREVKKA